MSPELLELLFQQLPVGVALFDLERRLVRCNPLYVQLVAQSTPVRREHIQPGVSLMELSPGNEALFEQALAQVMQGQTVRADGMRTESGGVVSYWDGVITPVFQEGRIVGFVDMVTDATQRVEALQKVQESEASLRSLVENAQHFAVYQTELVPDSEYGGRLVFFSPSICDIVGQDDLSDFENWFTNLHPDDQPRVLAASHHSWDTGEPYDQVTRVFHKRRNEWVWVHTIAAPLRNAEGRVTHFNGMVIDITDQVSLHEAERRRVAAEGLRDILRMINSNQALPAILQEIAVQAKRLLSADSTMIRQVSAENGRVWTVASCDLPGDFERIREQPYYGSHADRLLVTGDPVILEDVQAQYSASLADPALVDPLRRAGMEVTLAHYRSLLKMPLFIKDSIFGALTFHYCEAHHFSQEDLRLASTLADQAALAIENARLIDRVKETAVLEERSRLARELHDAVTQTLFSTTLTAEVLPKIWEKDPELGRRKLEELRELTRGALAEMRTLLVELRPAALEEADLKDLLRHLTNAFIARARIPALLELEGSCPPAPLEVKIAFYRIAQEALNNIARHAEASRVSVRLRQTGPQLTLMIEDDGVGFHPDEHRPGHLGLGIMRERAAQVGAHLQVESQPEVGTRISLDWTDSHTTGLDP